MVGGGTFLSRRVYCPHMIAVGVSGKNGTVHALCTSDRCQVELFASSGIQPTVYVVADHMSGCARLPRKTNHMPKWRPARSVRSSVFGGVG